MSTANPEVSVGASDSLILAVAITGFSVLAATLYFLLIRPTNAADPTRRDHHDENGGALLSYGQLKQAKVVDLNRAQRRARARTIAKEETKSLVSKQERLRMQRDIELRERHAEHEERDRLQQEQLQRAAIAKEQRDAWKQQERTAQTLAELEQWETFLKTESPPLPKRVLTVAELIERLELDRVLSIEDLSREFHGLAQELIVRRLNELVDDGRIAGVFTNNQTRFIYFADHELRRIAKEIESKQKISYDDLADFCNDQIMLSR